MSTGSKTIVRRLADEVINQGNLDLVEELFALELSEPVRQEFTAFRSAFPDWREEVVDLIAEGDKVVGRFRCSGTQQGSFMGSPPTGWRQEVDEVYIFRIKDGRIVEFWGLEDNWSRLRQLGLTQPQGSIASDR